MKSAVGSGNRVEEFLASKRWLHLCAEGIMLNLAQAVLQLKKERKQANSKVEQLDSALNWRVWANLSGRLGVLKRWAGNRELCQQRRSDELQRINSARWAKWKGTRRSK